MESLLEFVGTVHIFLGPYRGNPIGLYLQRDGEVCRISPRIYPWNQTIGVGDSPNKAAADFEQKWKETGLAPEMYTGPHWEGGIKPEKPKPAAPPKPAAKATTPSVDSSTASSSTPPTSLSEKPAESASPSNSSQAS